MILIDPGLSLHKGHCFGILCRQCCCKSIRFLKSTSKRLPCCRQWVFRSLNKHGQIWRHVTFHVKIEGHFGRIRNHTNRNKHPEDLHHISSSFHTCENFILQNTACFPNAVGEITLNWFVGSTWCIEKILFLSLFQILLGSTYFVRGWRRIRQPKQQIHQPTLRQPRFDNQGSTTKNGGFVNQGSSTKKLDSSTKRFVNQKSWIRQPKTADSSTKVRQLRFVNQGSSTKNTDSSTKDSSTKRLDSSTKNGGFINQGSSTKNTDSSTKDSSTKRLDWSKNGGFEGSGTFLACLEVEKLG